MSAAVDLKLDVGHGLFIACIRLLLRSRPRPKRFTANEEQIRSSPSSSSHGQRRPVVGRVTVKSSTL